MAWNEVNTESAVASTGNVQDSRNGVDLGESTRKRRRGRDGIRIYYALPKRRFINYVRFFMVLEICLSAALYCTVYAKRESSSTHGGSRAYGSSVYVEMILDVILVEMVQFALILFTHMRLETLAVKLTDTPFDQKLAVSKRRYHVFNIVLTILTLIYYCIKGSLMLVHQLHNNVSLNMIENYLMLFVTVCDCLHIAAAVVFCYKIRKVYAMSRDPKNIFFYNKTGLRVDSDGVPLHSSSKLKFPSHLRRVLALTVPECKLLVLGTVCLCAASVSAMLLPYYFGQVIDNALDPKSENLNRNVMILGVIAATGSAFAFVRGWAFSLAGYRLVSTLRKDLFRAIVRQEIAFFDMSRVGELTSRLSSDTQVIQTNITTNISMVLRYSVQIIGSVAVMLWLSAPLTAVLLAVIPVVAIGAAQYGRYYSRQVKAFQDALGIANTTAEESLSNIRTIRSFACDEKACDNYDTDVNNSLTLGKRLAFVYGMFQGVISFIIQAALVLMLWYGGKLVLEHSKDASIGVSIGVLSSFMMYALNVAMAFAFLSSIFGDIMKAVGASYRLFAIMDREPEVLEMGTVTLSPLDPSFQPKMEFRDVSFSYPARPNKDVLKNISFCVDAGQTVALVGPSGGGKSTCVNLLLHFYEPKHGQVLFSDQNIRDLKCDWYHAQIAVVSQEPVLFGFSVADNIAFGSQYTMEQIKEAATLANAHEFISTLDKGYNSLVGERGVRLSGGQKQRIAIARALIRNPKVLLLDEATSALDAESEAIVKDAIDRAMKNRTVLVIAHRLSTVIDADTVIVIEDGEIREMGSHQELINLDGVYKKLIVNQLMKTSESNLHLGNVQTDLETGKESKSVSKKSLLEVKNVENRHRSVGHARTSDSLLESEPTAGISVDGNSTEA